MKKDYSNLLWKYEGKTPLG